MFALTTKSVFFFFFSFGRGGAAGAEDESVNLNGSAGHEIPPPHPPSQKRGFEQTKSSSLDTHRWTLERSAHSGRMSCVIVSKACGRPGTLRSDQRARTGRRIFRWCHFEFGIKLINRINAEVFFFLAGVVVRSISWSRLDYGDDAPHPHPLARTVRLGESLPSPTEC